VTGAPKITVYVVSHNYGRFLEQAVESVLRQTEPDFELLIIDDGSTDDTAQAIEMYRHAPRVRTFRTEGIGLPAVCNLALRESRGRYFIRLDADDVFDDNILWVLGHELDRRTDVAMVFPDYYLMDDAGRIIGHERREKLYDRNHVFDAPANGACSLIRTSVLRDLGGYREDLGAQDGYDLWNKLLAQHRVGNVNLPLFYYRRHGNNSTDTPHRILQARRRITLDALADRLPAVRPITVLIPCRRAYDFALDVWKLCVNGRSLLAHNLERCLASSLFDRVVVACDSEEVREVMAEFDDPRLEFFRRNPEETTRSHSLASSFGRFGAQTNFSGVTVLSYVQAPMVRNPTLEEAVGTLVLNEADSAMGVEEVRDALFKREPHGLFPLSSSRKFKTDFDAIYKEANTALAFRTVNLKSGSITGSTMVHFIVDPDQCFFIDSVRKLKVAEILLGAG
jgi:glycosyltransferase involved in cell wall biosynthesis/CMP-N-acetylneuraminic acid synthetase